MTTIEEEAVEKIVLRVPVEMLEELRKAADASDMPVKDYILRLIDQDIKRRKPGIAPEKIAEVMKEDSDLSEAIREAQRRFDLLTREHAEATVNMINAKLENELQRAGEIQAQVLPRIMEEKNRILSEIRSLIENDKTPEDPS